MSDQPVVLPVDLRDYFAAKAIVGLLAEPAWTGDEKAPRHPYVLAMTAYKIADEMIKVRKS